MKFRLLIGFLLPLSVLILWNQLTPKSPPTKLGSFKISREVIKPKKEVTELAVDLSPTSSILYGADLPMGTIGVSDSIATDIAFDNIFHIHLEKQPTPEKEYWLIYDLKGVSDHTSISRSINDRLAVGGYLVNKNNNWSVQKERISHDWLRKGDNVVRFSFPPTIKVLGQIKSISIKEISKKIIDSKGIVLNLPQLNYYNDQAYLKGFIKGKDKALAQLFINNQPIENIDGEFEYTMIKQREIGEDWFVKIAAIYPNGDQIEKDITLNAQSESVDFITQITPKEKSKEQTAQPDEVNEIVAKGLKLVIPIGAIKQPEIIKIQPLQTVDLAPLPIDIVNVTPQNGGFRLLPHGTIFTKPINLQMTYDEELIPAGYTVADIRTYFFDEDQRKWTQISKKDLNKTVGHLTSSTNHFTDFINGIIKVPESPETNGYTPTSIKDLKAANPSANIQQMELPHPNNQGNLNTRINIKIPAGRNGMQPQIALSYNNEGGNGWLGLGWDYSTPAVSIETRWGVPRYDKDLETETYLLNGEQLTPLSHRDKFVPRYPKDHLFNRRVEGLFDRIIRHGDTPKEYWWEVTDKNGTVNYYGGLPDENVISEAVLKTEDGNIAHWCLTMTKDANGNFIRYTYKSINDNGIDSSSNLGKQIYIDKIFYTGHNDARGKYEIRFIRDTQLDDGDQFKRPDVNINGRLGFKQVTADLLRKIEVKFDGGMVRHYEFDYEEGAFFKTLLTSYREYDKAGQLFIEEEINYFDEVRDSLGKYQPYAVSKEWEVENDISLNSIDTTDDFTSKITLLGGGSSSNVTFGGAATIGLGCLPGKLLSVGGNYSRTKSDGEGLLAFTDIDGDRLPDKVIPIDGKLFYRKNLYKPTDSISSYSDLIPIKGDINKFSESSTKSSSKGIEANLTALFVGKTKSKSTTKTNIYFVNANNDQLIDICYKGVVYFNHINKDGLVEFTTDSGLTPNPISISGPINEEIMEVELINEDSLIDENPLIDMVKVWYAQEEGLINIHAPFQLIVSPESVQYSKSDGVKISIQKNDELLDSLTINKNDTALHELNLPNLISVKPQDRIFFRVQSIFDGAYDQVNWNPVISYNEASVPDSISINVNSKSRKKYAAIEDYLLASCQSTTLAFKGELSIESEFYKPITTDTLIAMIKLDNAIIYADTFAPQTEGRFPINITESVESDQELTFLISSETNIDWKSLDWQPFIFYSDFDDGRNPIGSDGNYILSYSPAVDFTMYNLPIRHTTYYNLQTTGDTVNKFSVKPILNYDITARKLKDLDEGFLTLTAKSKKRVYGRSKFKITKINNITFNVEGDENGFDIATAVDDSIFFEYHVSDFYLSKILDIDSIGILINDSLIKQPIGIFSKISPEQIPFGNLYRGWGNFGYNGNRNLANEIIDENRLKIERPKLDENGVDNIKGESEIPTQDDQTNAPINILFADPVSKSWKGYDNLTFVTASTMSSSRLGEDDIKQEDSMKFEEGVFNLPIKKSKSETTNKAKGASIYLSYTNTNATGSSKTIIDVMDLNVDGNPDIITEEKVLYSLPIGGFEQNNTVHKDIKNHISNNSSKGHTLGGSYPGSGSFSSGLPKIGKAGGLAAFVQNAGKSSEKATASIGVSVSGSFNDGDDEAVDSWMDINGDGLIDKVYKGGWVQLNIGYSFLPKEKWSFDAIREGKSEDFSGGGSLGYNKGNNGFSAGISLSRTDNHVSKTLQDVNGDGLVDIVIKGKPLKVQFNTGNGFTEEVEWNGINDIENGKSVGQSKNVAFTTSICIVIPLVVAFKISGSPSSSFGSGTSRQHTQITDINGDGYPDFLKSNNDGHLEVKASTIGKTNMLKSVKRAMGSTFTVDYERVGNTYDMPQSKWVMKEVEVFDGLVGDGADTTRMHFEYKNGFQNRQERTFYGFQQVITHDLDTENHDSTYRTTIQTFDNTNYYRKGLLLKQQTLDSQGNPFLETENKYVFQDLAGNIISNFDALRASIYPTLSETTERYYEGQTTIVLEQTMQYKYDALGNVIYYLDSGDKTEGDSVWAHITYHDLGNQYIKASPSSIEVRTKDGLERYRETTIDNFGNVLQIRQFLDATTSANHDMTYDQFGNLESITRPLNENSERLAFNYTYDDVVQTYITKVTDSYGYSSESEYEYFFGQLIKSIDLNKQEMRYVIDDRGRIETVTGPYELAEGLPYTIAFEYDHTAAVPYARTRHYDPETGGDIVTVTFMDGLQRPVQVKKTGVISAADGLSDTEGMIVSGRVKFDAFGRTVETYYPTTERKGQSLQFNDGFDDIPPTYTKFDILNRPLKVILPDDATTESTYTIAPDNNGLMAFRTKVMDAENHIRKTFTDIRKRERAKGARLSTNKTIWTNFDYNAISELLTVTDDGGHQTVYVYDQLGRKTSMTHPDAGKTEYLYDLANNLTSKITAEIRTKIPNGGAIKYAYEYERLVQVDFPRNFQNRVRYHYGDSTATHNRVGRIWLQEDASGGQEFFFGPLGEVIKNIRTIIVDPATQLTYVTQQKYDTWNRLQEMIYADGEVVTYDYNTAGKLVAMKGKKDNFDYTYVQQLRYDKFEQRTFLEYGNGTTTHYTFEDDRRRLKHLEVMGTANRQIINNTYEYDKVDNIMMVQNSVPLVMGSIGGSSLQTYDYDDIYRLTQATGNFMGNEFVADYQLNMTYDNLHNIIQKEQVQHQDSVLSEKLNYDLNYVYQQDRPHVPDSIGSVVYEYDANGNMTKWRDTTGVEMEFYFNEDNTLRGVKQPNHLSQYTYDASGERIIKSESSNYEGAFVNGTPAGFIRHDTAYTLYISPYLVVNKNRFTKHYFIEGQRITSKIGIGSFKNNMIIPNRGITAGNKNFVQRMQNMEREIRAIPSSPGHPTINYYYLDPALDTSQDPFPIFPSGNYDRPTDQWPQRRLDVDENTTEPPRHPTILETENITNDNVTAGYGYLDHPIILENEQFFYHPDHLGSSNYLTDINGEVRQHIEYTAFGETFVEEHTSSITQPYKFNDKELDDATGLYYYGARYYDPRISIWQSTDPLMEKYAGWSPYNYTLQNPVRYVDPDGKYVESAIEIASIAIGLNSFSDNIENGKFGSAILDAGGVALDIFALAIPLVPGGAGATLKAAKIAKAQDIVSYAEDTKDLVEGVSAGFNGNTEKSINQLHTLGYKKVIKLGLGKDGANLSKTKQNFGEKLGGIGVSKSLNTINPEKNKILQRTPNSNPKKSDKPSNWIHTGDRGNRLSRQKGAGAGGSHSEN